ncbi:hypothetical protein LHYA1_G000138 [Lachnellula hyalina]|uniref:Uncharacterized protein n=1 Tax=Lachnellula hyalina TaxID=1316788 RepID=A0A8H8RBH4_9HELO|nr:uncharacterized protein LHYA1_G000138 [Lachnellula hyalina]TVY31089.1 hypothetical protein LHYA1_G000138 [Lachnellula hyalina]
MKLNFPIAKFLVLCLPCALAQDPAAVAAAVTTAAAAAAVVATTAVPAVEATTAVPAVAATTAVAAAAAAPAAVNVGVAAGGGVVASSAATQYPTETTAGSLFTSNGVTSATWVLFIQTFATTALGSWDLGASPQAGSIGLGSIAGTVGAVNTNAKRALETPAPRI